MLHLTVRDFVTATLLRSEAQAIKHVRQGVCTGNKGFIQLLAYQIMC